MTGRTYRNLAAAVAVIALIIGGAADVERPEEGRDHPGRQPGRAADAGRALDDGQHHGDPHEPPLRGAPHAGRREQAHPDARRGHADGLAGRPHLHVQAPARHQVPQRQGDDVGRRGRLAHAVEQAVDLRQGPVQLRRRGRPPGGRQVHRRAEAQGEGGDRPDQPGGGQQLRRHLPEGDRREVPAGREGHGVRRDRPLQARRVEARPVHPDGPLRRLQAPEREAQRLRRREDRLRRRDPLDPGAGRRDPRRPDGDRGARAGRRPERRRLRPAEGERQLAPDHRRSCTTGSSRSSTRRRA